MTVSNICILGTIAVYLVGMLIIGFRCARKNESSADFYLGGRKLGPLVTAMSAEASDMSSYLLMGLPGLAYLSGVADVGWTAQTAQIYPGDRLVHYSAVLLPPLQG